MGISYFTILPYKDKILKLDNLKSGKIVYKNFYIDLISNQSIPFSSYEWFQDSYEKVKTFYTAPRIIHFFYEFGFITEKFEAGSIGENTILAIELVYQEYNFIELDEVSNLGIEVVKTPTLEEYTRLFNTGFKELIAGNCYQFNLTMPFKFSFNKDKTPKDFIDTIWNQTKNRGAYGSATFIPLLNKLFLSNSPECLFQIKENEIFSMPIKGTIACNDLDDKNKKWNELTADKKCESELYMIADLIRNDLSRIDKPRSIVIQRKVPLIVPGLLHQYSHLKVKVSEEIKINKVIEKMFPGGSITGAPKNRVMKILRSLENRERGFYCGSTLLSFADTKCASINIRSAEIDFDSGELTYQAGGGITIKSTSDIEFQEMSYKVNSFTRLLNP